MSASGSPPPTEPAAAHRTALYAARVSDPRERAALPHELLRGRAARKAETTSDVTRFRGILAGALAAAAAVALAMWLWPPPGGLAGSPGPLARPHALAKLECASCHVDPGAAATTSAPSPAASASAARREPSLALQPGACVRCHGPHPSARPGHQRLAASGQPIPCQGCHAVHRGDQGVTFGPDAPVRFAPGTEIALDEPAFHPTRATTVPLVQASSCAGCHALDAPGDPITRCLLGDQAALGGARPVVCFDEHQPSLPADGPQPAGAGRPRPGDPNEPRRPPQGGEGRGAPRPPPPSGGVCAAQHGTDRAAAWEAARAVAAAQPVLAAGGATSGRPALWLGFGLLAAALATGAVRAGHAWRARRKRAPAAPAPALAPAARVRLPQIDVNTCIGCYACVDACPYDVLEIERYVAKVARPDACCGLTLCEQRCPNGSLRITDGEPIGERPRLTEALESPDMPGLFLAGDVTGLPLIKNAIHQGAMAARSVQRSLEQAGERRGQGVLDLLVVGAGPAGISAALEAKSLGLSFEVVEQGSVAQSIQSFPRGKVVFDQPLELPVAGKLWLRESSKEELLVQWMRVVRQERLPIRQDTRMLGLRREGGLFRVAIAPRSGGAPEEILARRVILSIGQRGQPRRLPFELGAEVVSRVHYHLADARSFAGQRVLVVGLGDVAMEAAIALARQPGTRVTVVYRGSGFRRGKTRNIEELTRLVQSGRATLLFDTELDAIGPEGAVLRGRSGTRQLPCDAVLVLIGNIPPWSTLREAGVRLHAEAPLPAPARPPDEIELPNPP